MGKSCGKHKFFSLGGQYYSLGHPSIDITLHLKCEHLKNPTSDPTIFLSVDFCRWKGTGNNSLLKCLLSLVDWKINV